MTGSKVWARRTTAAALAAVVAAVLAGCSETSGRAAAGASPTPQLLQAEGLATQEFGLLSGGGWAQAWSLWTPAARQAVPQSAYVRVNKACPLAPGEPYVIDKAAPTDGDPARITVTWEHGGSTGTNLVVYQGGTWRFVPASTDLAQYQAGADQLIQKRKAAGECR